MKFFLSLFLILGLNSAFGARPIRGTYEVPVTSDLKDFAQYPVKFKANNYQDIPTELAFPLPAALAGEEKIISMVPIATGSQIWVGPQAQGQCQLMDRLFSCQVKFNNLLIDTQKVQSVVATTYLDPQEQAAKLQVAMRFIDEPIGIIVYKLRGKNK